jgi:hypothetical protein
LLAVLLTFGILAVAAGPTVSAPAQASHSKGKSEKAKSNHGKDKHKKPKKAKKVKAMPTADYVVTVTCDYDSAADQSTCEIGAQAPAGAKKVQHVDLAAEQLCAEVLGGDADIADPDPHTGVNGYRSHGTEARFSLILAGEVTTDGHAIYWIKAASAIFPVNGPGFSCGNDQSKQLPEPGTTPQPSATAQAAQEVNDSSGSIVVVVRDCPVDSPPSEYDWYGACDVAESGLRYHLMPMDTATRDGLATSTDGEGRATFRLLVPGTYELTQANGDWCHAQSDNVDSDGNLIVDAGARTTVWIFTCGSGMTAEASGS